MGRDLDSLSSKKQWSIVCSSIESGYSAVAQSVDELMRLGMSLGLPTSTPVINYGYQFIWIKVQTKFFVSQ